jgi:hypothetical protein
MEGWPRDWRRQTRSHPQDNTPDPAQLLAESRRLTDKMDAARREWAAGRGKDYGTALDFIVSNGRRSIIIADLRSRFRLVEGGKRG